MSRRKIFWMALKNNSSSPACATQFSRGSLVLIAICALLLPALANAEHRGSRGDHRGNHRGDHRGDHRGEHRGERHGRHDHGERYERKQDRGYSDFSRPGFYLGAGLVGGFATRLESELHEIPGVTDVEVDPSVGLTARAGVRVTPHIALEAHYEWIDNFETSVAGTEIADTRTQALTGDVKGYLATGRVQPFLTLGAGFLTATSDDPVTNFRRTDTDFAARVGGGIDFYLNESVGLSLDTSYVVPTGDVQDLDYVSAGAGVFFRF